jgi:hypothetical protein
MANFLPAAAVPEGAEVLVPDRVENGNTPSMLQITVNTIENNTPVAGKITWHDKRGITVTVGAATMIEIVSLP